jgi:hypothetical protein
LCRCVDGVTAVTFGRVLSAEVLVAGAVVGTPVQSHEGSRREFAGQSTRASIGVAVGVKEFTDLFWAASRSQNVRRTIREDRQALVVAANLRAVARASGGARVLNDLGSSVLQLITAVAL